MRRSVDFCYFLISRNATILGLNLRFFWFGIASFSLPSSSSSFYRGWIFSKNPSWNLSSLVSSSSLLCSSHLRTKCFFFKRKCNYDFLGGFVGSALYKLSLSNFRLALGSSSLQLFEIP